MLDQARDKMRSNEPSATGYECSCQGIVMTLYTDPGARPSEDEVAATASTQAVLAPGPSWRLSAGRSVDGDRGRHLSAAHAPADGVICRP